MGWAEHSNCIRGPVRSSFCSKLGLTPPTKDRYYLKHHFYNDFGWQQHIHEVKNESSPVHWYAVVTCFGRQAGSTRLNALCFTFTLHLRWWNLSQKTGCCSNDTRDINYLPLRGLQTLIWRENAPLSVSRYISSNQRTFDWRCFL